MSKSTVDQAALDAVTAVGEDRFILVWKFEKFSPGTGTHTSSTLKLKTKDHLIQCFIYGNPNSFRDNFKCYHNHFRLIFDHIKQNVILRCSMSLIDSSGNRKFIQECTVTHNSASASFDIKTDYIFDLKSESSDNKTLTVYFEVNILNEEKKYALPNYLQQAVTRKTLLDYESLLENAKFSDVILVVGKSGATKEFNAHKNILSARSAVFGAMFEHKDTKESKENRVVITDVSADVFEQFIRFLYTGKVVAMKNHASDLLFVADKYQMDCLKSLCSHYLLSTLTVESVASTLVLADLHNVSELKSNCIDYIVEHANEVMATKDWKLIKDNTEMLEQLFIISSKQVVRQKRNKTAPAKASNLFRCFPNLASIN